MDSIKSSSFLTQRDSQVTYTARARTLQRGMSLFLTPREVEKLMISVAAEVARKRLQKGLKLNYPECVAIISDFIQEGAREGKSVATLMKESRKILKASGVMAGVPQMVRTVHVEATFRDGTKLVTVHDPIT